MTAAPAVLTVPAAAAAVPAVARIRVATTSAETQAIARLRYEVYVEEMGRRQPHADHAVREIREPLDGEGMVLGAFLADGAAVGTLRVNTTASPSIEFRELYGWEARAAAFPGATFLASKLVVARSRRQHSTAVDLMRAGARLGVRNGWRFAWLDANAHLVQLYTRLGFRLQHERHHPLFGRVSIMELDLLDTAHLQSIRSPLVRDRLERLVPNTDAAA